LATAGLFFVNGLVYSNWLPRIPEVRDRLGVSNGGLGVTLIGGGLGGLIGSFAVAKLLAKFGSRTTVLVAASLLALGLPLIAVVPNAFALACLLSLLGFIDVNNDVAMNAQGVSAQGRLGKSIMNRLHAFWSVGGVVGAGIGSLASAAKIGLGVHLSCVAVVQLLTIAAASTSLLRVDPAIEPLKAATQPDGTTRKARLISPTVIAMALMAIGIAWLEITPGDWSAVAMKDIFSAGKLIGFAPVVFAGMMLVGRLGGDHVLDRIGSDNLLGLALAIAAVGGVIVVVAPITAVALIGFGIWGLGVSVIFPQLYAMAATLPGTAAGAGLGAMALGQRFGFMIGSAAVGAIADWQTLRWSFAAAIIGAVTLTLLTRPILQRKPELVGAS
jgi:predicted MFS family arabinose efflux permease